jgi:hypothetical protein
MNSRTIDVVTGWETVATPGGYEGLRQLADAGFSGAVSAGTTWAFFLNGRIVGIFEGGIEEFEDFDATAYRAADPSLPLLFAMQERDGETRANYYTNETPLRDVDRTLENGGFTGYVELSENVLSGDYYVVYHGGKSMSAAFVGSSERLVTGKEAFETAADEVGIYEVVDVDIDLVDIPEPESTGEGSDGTDAGGADGSSGAAAAAGVADGADADASGTSESESREDAADGEYPSTPDSAPAAEPDTGTEAGMSDPTDADATPEPPADDGPDPLSDDGGAGLEPEPDGERAVEPEPDSERAVKPEPDADPDSEAGHDAGAEAGASDPTEAGATSEPSTDDDIDSDSDKADGEGAPVGRETATDPTGTADTGTGPPAEDDTPATTGSDAEDDAEPAADEEAEAESPTAAGGSASRREPTGSQAGTQPAGAGSGDSTLTDEQRWQRARTIPSLDPESSTGDGEEGADTDERGDAARERTAQMQRQRRRRRAARDRTASEAGRDATAQSGSGGDSRTRSDSDEVTQLQKRLSAAKGRIESLEAERDDLLAEREELIEERDSLRSEQSERVERIEELEAERDRLRSEVDRLQSQEDAGDGGGGDAHSESMSPDRALSGTNLFVRYDSKGQATLKHAHSGEASRSDVRENLRLEHHTTFEAEGVAVDDQPYEEFLHDSTEYAFARWVVSDLLYEIGETGNRSELAGVFDAIPEIDRVELRGDVGVETDDGVESHAFDVVFRDRMGDPLFVADLNPSRNATTESMVGSLVENTHTVASEAETVGAGFYVTESFYEPGALETVADRTGGGILSRSSKRSFVKLSRKRGYHLCLVEARDGEFHLNVPEL